MVLTLSLPSWWHSSKPYIIDDCAVGMKKLPADCVSFLLTDPPYGTADEGKTIKRGSEYESFDIEWDGVLPLDYIGELFRILKDDRFGVIFTDKMAVTTVWDKLKSVGFKPKNTYYVIKNNPPPNPRHNFMSGVEVAIVFQKGNATPRWHGGGTTKNYEIVNMIGGDEEVVHPTQKHVSTFENLINLLSNPGDIVLDPFLGSGTTLLAARRTGRVGLGFEINSGYAPVIESRGIVSVKYLEDF